jgi:hypothetical protein
MISRRFVFLGVLLLFSGGISVGRSQDASATTSRLQPTSLGDAARKERAQKKEPSKPAKVFTNDDMGRLKHTHSVVSSHSAPPSLTTDKKPSR